MLADCISKQNFQNKKSDLDVKIEYTGNAREDDMLNALNDKKTSLKIENIRVDFYPEKYWSINLEA
jgi:hypothetical protein